jgi:putative endonuclease
VFASFTRGTIRLLDRVLPKSRDRDIPAHHRIGRRGEEEAYFFLRTRGYVMVARNYRSARRRGEIDLVGWDEGVLCFVEVKTRTSRDVKPAEAAVDREKRRELSGMARDYMRRIRDEVRRFDVVSIYYEKPGEPPHIELFKNAFPVS